jgi:hypothetical protein
MISRAVELNTKFKIGNIKEMTYLWKSSIDWRRILKTIFKKYVGGGGVELE